MAERNFTEVMSQALLDAQHARNMIEPLLDLIHQESGFFYSDAEAAGRASGRIMALADSALNYSKQMLTALDSIDLGQVPIAVKSE